MPMLVSNDADGRTTNASKAGFEPRMRMNEQGATTVRAEHSLLT